MTVDSIRLVRALEIECANWSPSVESAQEDGIQSAVLMMPAIPWECFGRLMELALMTRRSPGQAPRRRDFLRSGLHSESGEKIRNARALRLGLWRLALLLSSAALAPLYGQAVELVTPVLASPAAGFGAEEVKAALRAAGAQVNTDGQGSASIFRLVLGVRGDAVLSRLGAANSPQKPESYALSLPVPGVIVVEGSDATGLMYGALDLAEQIRGIGDAGRLGQVKPAAKSPYLALRGINMFLTVQDIDLPGGAFWSDEFWTGYLDMMARNRYNLLDIHGLCDAVSLVFPDGFSYFVSLPEFPEVGVGKAQAAKNLARFRQVVRMAADRGIKVGYMNYRAAPTIGPWKTRRYGTDERWTLPEQKFITGPRLEQYTREAVRSFLKQMPELWMLGFRIGESGQPEDFYKKTYLAALDQAPSGLNLYVRTWIADPAKVREIAGATRQHLYIEPKYNGEHLGLPYQAALGGREYAPSGSFENYTNQPKNYTILWQIRAHGTHRFFYWGSPEFARRTVRSCRFGDGAGFSMETMNAYCPEGEYLHNNPDVDHRFYTWMYERQWLWHMVWGRTAYDPDVPDLVFRQEFARRFGPQAGAAIYDAIVASSRIVPFVYSYHNVGLDHQDFSPETETGDHAFGARGRQWQGSRLVPYGGNNEDFLNVRALDRTAMADPVSYVGHYLNRVPDGRMTPDEAARYLDSAAQVSMDAIGSAAKLNPQEHKEFDCIRRDVEAVAWLARYYADRIRSATHLEFYRRTHHHPELTAAYDSLKHAAENWDHLSEVADEHFGHVPETIRMGVSQFRWRDEGRGLGVDLDHLNNLEAEFAQPRKWVPMTIGHVPPRKSAPGESVPLTVTCPAAGDAGHVYLFYRNNSDSEFVKVPLQQANRVERTWRGEIPAAAAKPGDLEYYFEAESGVNYGASIPERPPYVIRVSTDESRPVVRPEKPVGPVRGASVELTLDVDSEARLSTVRLFYKRMPSGYEWRQVDMRPAGGHRYTSRVPLTPEGILYYFEAIDENGNGVHYPDVLKETPYLALDSWASPGAPE